MKKIFCCSSLFVIVSAFSLENCSRRRFFHALQRFVGFVSSSSNIHNNAFCSLRCRSIAETRFELKFLGKNFSCSGFGRCRCFCWFVEDIFFKLKESKNEFVQVRLLIWSMFECKTTVNWRKANGEIIDTPSMDSFEFAGKKHQLNYSMVTKFFLLFVLNLWVSLGASMAVTRGAFVTVGQIAFYEQVKQILLATGHFNDNIVTHFSSSFVAGNLSFVMWKALICLLSWQVQ